MNLLTNSYSKALVLNKASLDMICAPSIGEEQAAKFEKKYYAVRYIFNEAKFKIGWFLYVPLNTVKIICVAI